MKFHRLLFALFVVINAVLAEPVISGVTVQASPPQRTCAPGFAVIALPASGSTLNGTIDIIGSATLNGEMDFYELAIAPMENEAWWAFLPVARGERRNASLGALDARRLSPGVYRIRLRVVDFTGNYCEGYAVNLFAGNVPGAPPAEPPTPEGTPSPLPTLDNNGPTPRPSPTSKTPQTQTTFPTLPAVVGLPTDTPTPPVPSTPVILSSVRRTATPSSFITDLMNPGGITEKASGVVSGFSDGLALGIRIMASLIILVGIVFVLRYWL